MALINYTITAEQEDHKYLVTWGDVTQADTAKPFEFQELAGNITIEASGTFGAATLTMAAGNGAPCLGTVGITSAWTEDSVFSILERPSTITPTFSGGSGQSVTVEMVVWYLK